MLKIEQHFLFKYFILCFTMFILFISFSYFYVKSTVVSQHKEVLKSTMEIISLELNHIKDLKSFTRAVESKSQVSVAIITLDGKVLTASNHDASVIKNHMNKKEFMQAQSNEYGESVEFSRKLKVDVLYLAKVISYAGQDVYLHVGMPLSTLMSTFYTTLLILFAMFALGFLVVVYVLKEIHHNLSEEMDQFKKYLESIAAKDYEAVLHIKYFYELLEISLILKNIIKRLYQKDKKKK